MPDKVMYSQYLNYSLGFNLLNLLIGIVLLIFLFFCVFPKIREFIIEDSAPEFSDHSCVMFITIILSIIPFVLIYKSSSNLLEIIIAPDFYVHEYIESTRK